jgi:hypothetical protein
MNLKLGEIKPGSTSDKLEIPQLGPEGFNREWCMHRVGRHTWCRVKREYYGNSRVETFCNMS